MRTDTEAPADNTHMIVLGVTGSIAAYKAADLTSRLVLQGISVDVVMTLNATRLVQPLTFHTLSRRPVVTDLWDIPQWQPGHIALADRAELLVIAPATANVMAKLAHGIADDALSTFALSHCGPMIIAPAMNPKMWAHAAVQANCEVLRGRGIRFVGPGRGRVACGDDGPGRLAPVTDIVAAIREELGMPADCPEN